MLLVHNIPHFEYLVHHNCIQVYVKLLVTEGEKKINRLMFQGTFFFFFFGEIYLLRFLHSSSKGFSMF